MIADLYVNLCCNYQPNDRIYIFGFSRGAVVARGIRRTYRERNLRIRIGISRKR